MDLDELRMNIDKTDDELLRLFLRRMELAGEVAAAKRESGGQVFRPEREREILLRVSKAAPEELLPYVRRLFETLFGLSRAYQTQLLRTKEAALTARLRTAVEKTPSRFPESARVACQGVMGAYSQLACDKLFPMADILYFKNFEGVMSAVEQGLCQYGVLPIENSTHGVVNEVYDLMRAHKVYIVRGTRLQISHALLAKPGVALEDVREIFSHEQALGQCAAFLARHPEIKVTVCENTAVAARLVSQSDRRDIASISSPECARLYGLGTLVERVQSEETNYTRFICVSRDLEIYPGANKISFLAATEHRPGALYTLLAKFALLGVNISKLESRPIPGRDFDFMFYFDLDADPRSDALLTLLGDLSEGPELFQFLGAYPETL